MSHDETRHDQDQQDEVGQDQRLGLGHALGLPIGEGSIPGEWVEVFGQGWHSVPEGEPGDRRRAGLYAVESLIRSDERIRMRDKAASATITTDGDLSVLNVDDPYGVGWTPVSIDLIKMLVEHRNAEVARIKSDERKAVLAEERTRMQALARMLLDSGDITPMAARLISRGRDDE